MRVSRRCKASAHCLPSPDGRFVATLLPGGVHVRAVDRLDEGASVVALPADLAVGAVTSFQWSASSERVLVATADQILVASVRTSEDEDGEEEDRAGGGEPFRAVVRHPALPVVARPAFVGFSPDGEHVGVSSAHGIKFAVFDLRTGKTVEIANPKLASSAAANTAAAGGGGGRGFAFRPASHHLTLLTRTAGKDWVSVHDPRTARPAASWAPDTVDAQGLVWSPDGRWIVLWDAPAHGHKVLFYTPDGHLFRTWTAAAAGGHLREGVAAEDAPGTVDESLGPGVRLVHFAPDGRTLAVGDASRSVHLIDMASVVATHRLLHPTALSPQRHTFKIWQEQIDQSDPRASVDAHHCFVEAAQDVSPPGRSGSTGSGTAADVPSAGCTLLAFDCSSTLLVTRLDEAPSTLWVWNRAKATLCAVLMLHANVSSAVWHATMAQTLLITCEGDRHRGLGLVWRPLDGAPCVADFSQSTESSATAAASESQPGSGGVPARKQRLTWLNLEGAPPSLFYSDGASFALAALDEASLGRDSGGGRAVPWSVAENRLSAGSFMGGLKQPADERIREESPLELVPADDGMDSNPSDLEDTFHYKRNE